MRLKEADYSMEKLATQDVIRVISKLIISFMRLVFHKLGQEKAIILMVILKGMMILD